MFKGARHFLKCLAPGKSIFNVTDHKKITFRTAGVDDVQTIVSLSAALFREDGGQPDPGINVRWPEEYGEDYYRPLLETDSHLGLLAEVNGQVVGYLFGSLKDLSSLHIGRSAELETMYVQKVYRSRGIGGKLARQFLSWAKEKGAERVSVWAYATNERAINFYRRLGFESMNLTLVMDLKCVDLYFDLADQKKDVG